VLWEKIKNSKTTLNNSSPLIVKDTAAGLKGQTFLKN
jgi:hypothetical protein